MSPELKPYFRLRKSELIEQLGHHYFIAETFRVIQQLLDSEVEIHSLLTTKVWLDRLGGFERVSQRVHPDRVYIQSQKTMEQIVGFNLHQGVMAIAKRPSDHPLDRLDSKIIAVNGVVNPENIGSLVRTLVALGYRSFLGDQKSADPFLRRAVRVSMGNVFRIHHHCTSTMVESLKHLKALGYCIIGSDIRNPTAYLPEFSYPQRFVLIIGSEFNGMDPEVLALCDEIVAIPGDVPMNASHAAAVLMYAGKAQIKT